VSDSAVAEYKSPVRTQKLAVMLLIAVLVWLLVQSFGFGMAYVDQYRINASIDRWQRADKPLTDNDWRDLQGFARQALARYPDSVDLINAVGRLYDFRAGMTADHKTGRSMLIKARGYYEQVTRLRPAWPYGWLNLAWVKARMGEPDREFRRAFMRLLVLAPWERNTLPSLVQLGVYGWRYLKPNEQRRLTGYFTLAEQARRGDMRGALKASGQLQHYCAMMQTSRIRTSLCSDPGAGK